MTFFFSFSNEYEIWNASKSERNSEISSSTVSRLRSTTSNREENQCKTHRFSRSLHKKTRERHVNCSMRNYFQVELKFFRILYADIVNFTPLSEKFTPPELVQILNKLFGKFDQLAQVKEKEIFQFFSFNEMNRCSFVR